MTLTVYGILIIIIVAFTWGFVIGVLVGAKKEREEIEEEEK